MITDVTNIAQCSLGSWDLQVRALSCPNLRHLCEPCRNPSFSSPACHTETVLLLVPQPTWLPKPPRVSGLLEAPPSSLPWPPRPSSHEGPWAGAPTPHMQAPGDVCQTWALSFYYGRDLWGFGSLSLNCVLENFPACSIPLENIGK